MDKLLTMGLYLVVGTFGGYVGLRFKATGSVIICSMLAVLAVRLFLKHDISLPKSFFFMIQVLVGIMVAASYTPDMAKVFPKIAIPVIVTTLVLVFSGMFIGLILNKLKILDISTSYLGTSPGGMAALIALAKDAKANTTVVAVFHFFRLVFIVITAPIVFYLWKIILDKPPH